LTDVGKLADVVLNCGEDFRQSAIIKKVGGKNFFEVEEASTQLVFVDLAGAILFFVFDDEGGTRSTEKFDDFEPVIEIGIVLAGIGNEEIERAFGEEELMGGMIDFLTAKIPDINTEGVATGVRKVEP
jgi:hypothetical protein